MATSNQITITFEDPAPGFHAGVGFGIGPTTSEHIRLGSTAIK